MLRRGWSIGTHRVYLEVKANLFVVTVDGAAAPVVAQRSNLLGIWPFQVGDRVAMIRRVRTIDVARNELWVDGVRIPQSAEPILPKKAAARALCKAHRGLAPPAELACGVCGTALCAACTAVDDLRCVACFEGAVEKLRKEDRAKQVFGVVAAIVLIAAIGLVGLAVHSPKVFGCAVGLTVLLVFLLINGFVRGRLEARAVALPAAAPRRARLADGRSAAPPRNG